MLTAASTGWVVGIVLGVVVIAVAAVIVITIVALAQRIARQAKTAEEAVEVVRRQTAELDGVARINDSGVRILHAARALRKVAVGQVSSSRSRSHELLDDRAGDRPRRRAGGRRAAGGAAAQRRPKIQRSVDGPARDRGQGRRQHGEHPAARGNRARCWRRSSTRPSCRTAT